ncbi:solute carrier family 22 member 3 [Drosophila rhopaloa]|uniref:Major facilitator superfamily (MFS) profile domain-containing protein n=1 Tax=Drosophila rhopaloa TaxID=1041015 RepID=A0ABM5HJN4_DRORH|nr:solute carrier family 22 member 3 [Drosophila rhopaloa]
MPSEDCKKYENFLPLIGDFGPYQRRLMFWMMPAAFLFAFTYFGQIFMIHVPTGHWCRIRELEGLPKEEQIKRGIPIGKDGEFERCHRYNVPFESDTSEETNQTRTKIPCNDGWVYDPDEMPYESIATQYNWVCDKDGLGTYSVMAFFIGSIVGCLCFGYAADHCGRLVALFLANSCSMIGGCISALCKDFYCFAASRYVVGMAMNNCFLPIYILTLENVGIQYRTLVGNSALAISFTLGACALPWVAYFIRNWRHYAMVVALPVILMILMSLLLPESPSWLFSVGKVERGMEVLKEAAQSNGKTISDKEWSEMQQCHEQSFAKENSGKHYTILDLFKTFRRFVVTSILIMCWMIVALVYDAHVRVVSLLDTDVFITFSLSSLVEIPAGIVPILLLDRVGRKPVMAAVMLFCAVFSLLAGLLQRQWDVAIAAIIARFFVTIAYNVGQQWASEILPTVVRGQGLAAINVMGHTGALISPIVIYTHRYYRALPMFIITLLSVIGGVIVFILPETKGTVLPHTMDESDKRWTLRCRERQNN